MHTSSATTYSGPVAHAPDFERTDFIRKTYHHLALAIIALVGIEYFLLQWGGAEPLIRTMTSGYGWLVVLGLFMFVSYIADGWARSDTSPQMQYLGLGLYVLAQAILLLPLLYIATTYAGREVLPNAALMTGLLFTGLTFAAFTTGKDFSFLRTALTVGGFLALGLIVASILFGFSLGLLFSAAMIVYAAGSILYSTSNVIHHYRSDQHVAAALSLFAAVTLLFWYVLQLFMSFGDD